MSDFESFGVAEIDQVVKGYDPVIMRRLLGFLKPHARTVALAVAGLLLATLAELLLPVVLQKTIDRYIIVEYCRLSASALGEPGVRPLKITPADPTIGGYVYLLASRLSLLTGVEKASLERDGTIDDTPRYVFRLDPARADLDRVLRAHPGLFALGDRYGAIRSEDLKELSKGEIDTIRADDFRGVALGAAKYLALLVGVLLFSFLQVYFMSLTGQGVMKSLRLRLLDHTLHQSLGYLTSNPVGSLVSRVTNDVETINDLFTTVATSFLQDGAMMIGAVVTLFLLNPKLALIALCTLPPVLLATVFFRFKARDAYRRLRMWVSQVNAYISEHIAGVGVVQMFARERRSVAEFVERNTKLLRATLAEMYVFAAFRPLTDLFTSVSIGVVLYFGTGMFIRNAVSLGVLIAFLNLINKFYQPVMDLSEKFTVLQSAMAGGERVFDLLDTDSRIPDAGTRSLPEPLRGAIAFEGVGFAYKSDEPVLKGVTFAIEPGETVAIVGYTGAGKTTIINLLTRLWDVTSGAIRLDGIDIRELKLRDLRRVIQPVQQDVFIFSGTVEENIALGSGIPLERVKEAVRVVHAERIVERLPGGYRAELHEGGANLSTGERQLLSFARVVAHDPQIVVLDEATGSVDTETEKLIQGALRALLAGRTSLVIAHRISTIQHADRILVLSNGVLVEQGSHSELLARGGVYQSLYRLQYETSLASGRS